MKNAQQSSLFMRRFRRFLVIIAVALCVGGGVFLLMRANTDSLVFFKTPTEVLSMVDAHSARQLRLGGQVKQGSVKFDAAGVYRFQVTDGTNDIMVEFNGTLPDLFREGQGVVAEGSLNVQKLFIAKRVLAKHDENYKPPQNAPAMPAGPAK